MDLTPRAKSSSVERVTGTGATAGVNRRQFLNRALGTTLAFVGAAWSASVVGFLWPSRVVKGFGGTVQAGAVDFLHQAITATEAPVYVPAARAYVSPYPKAALPAARRAKYPHVLADVLEAGLLVQSQTCPHLGCKVAWCPTSQWFECPCHGSKYNRVGEKKAGPAPRGMSLVAARIRHGELVIDSGTVLQGMPIGTDTTGQKQEGPFCYK